jgi:hypothetical protein
VQPRDLIDQRSTVGLRAGERIGRLAVRDDAVWLAEVLTDVEVEQLAGPKLTSPDIDSEASGLDGRS